MSVDIRNCPFCGSDDVQSGGTLGAFCETCGAVGPDLSSSDEHATWNTRAPDPEVAVLEAEVARLRGWIQMLDPHLDAVICYASDMGEHPPNRAVSEVRSYLAALNSAPSEKEAG